ncbi:MAG: GNAT family N-acetyltransferase [Anaerolineae bacterium]|nr:GNAT family N-acetyltransferase [Anaerolineae bacterium]
MALATWWRGDFLPTLPPLTNFHVQKIQQTGLLAALCRLDGREIHRRRQQGHRPYVAIWQGSPVAYGWVATQRADIGELGLDFRLPPQHRYLWDFATLPAYRGQGIYPRLLQEILVQEASAAAYFWIIRAPENGASGAGIHKAGFTAVGHLSLLANGRTALAVTGNRERAKVGAGLLGVPLAADGISPCWHCGGADYPAAASAAACSCRPAYLEEMADCACVSGSGRPHPVYQPALA